MLAGEGRAFLAGGDVAAFHEAGDGVQEHVRGLIGLLEETITVLDRLRMPVHRPRPGRCGRARG